MPVMRVKVAIGLMTVLMVLLALGSISTGAYGQYKKNIPVFNKDDYDDERYTVSGRSYKHGSVVVEVNPVKGEKRTEPTC